jgi:hypothetical protein
MSEQQGAIYRAAKDLVGEYETVIQRIKNACQNFDSGAFIDPGTMALQLRILLIDSSAGSRGRSLMNIMGVSQKQRLLSTVPQPITERTISSMGFLGLVGSGQEIHWKPSLQTIPGSQRLLATDRWLSENVFKGKGITFDRKKVIKTIADRENGAHVDPTIDPEYYEIANNNGSGFVFVHEDGKEIPLGNPFPALLRQLCYEILMTDARLRNEGWLWIVENKQ